LAWWWIEPARAVAVAVAVLIVTCPCALTLAAPAAWLTASGALARRGLLLADLSALERLCNVDTVIFDKTGTLTEGRLALRAIRPLGTLNSDLCLSLAAALENRSEHPIARAFGRAPLAADEVLSSPGLGLEGRVGDRH
ncbi:HAD family hydrolase, partial [Klebsiella variicola]|uniref:HAD family hydrolase n=1 Tax=Klebsiella variicola TaxID=244366 RepID=UPI00272F1799